MTHRSSSLPPPRSRARAALGAPLALAAAATLAALSGWGCVQVVDFDPVGSAISLSASWTLAGAPADTASCSEQGVSFVRVSFFDYVEDVDNPSERRVDHAGLVLPCRCGSFDTRVTGDARDLLPEGCRAPEGKVIRALEGALYWNIRLLGVERQSGQVRSESDRRQHYETDHIEMAPVVLAFTPLVPPRPRGQWASSSARFSLHWDPARCGGASALEVVAFPNTDDDLTNGVVLLSAPCADGAFDSTYLDEATGDRRCDPSLGEACYLRSGLYRLRYRALDAAGGECEVFDRSGTFEVSDVENARLPSPDRDWCAGG